MLVTQQPVLRRFWYAVMPMEKLDAEKQIARSIQLQAFIDVPYLPVGQFSQATAYSKKLTDVLKGYALFWNVRKSA